MAGKETVKGTFGNESIELNNAATEATLTALLAIAKKDSVVLMEMAKKAGISAKKLEDSLAKSNNGTPDAGPSKGVNLLGGAAKMAGGFIADLAGGVMKTAGNLLGFGQQLLDGTAKASDFAAAFKDLPLGMGLFAQAMAMSTRYFEANFNAYKALSNSGAGLVGGLDTMKIAATRMGLSLEEYGAMFSKNGDVMVRLGGAMSLGSKNLVNMNQSFIQSDLGKNLLYLGFSYAELNDMIPNYIRATGDSIDITKNYATEVKRIQQSSAKYGEDLDFLARMTGESREEAQKKMQAQMQEASFQMWLLKQPKAQQEAIREAISRELIVGGKGAADVLKAKLTGFAGPFSKEGQAFTAIFGDGTRAVDDMVKIIKSSLPAQEKTAALDKLMAKQISSNIGDLDKYSSYIMAMGQGADGGARALLEFTELTNKYRNAEGGKALSQEKIMEIMKKVRDDQAADAKKAKAMADQDLAMKQISANFQATLLPLMKQLNELTGDLVKWFDKWVKQHMPAITEGFQKIADWIKKVFDHPEEAINDIKSLFKELLAGLLELATQSWWGRRLFGEDAAARLQNSALIDKGKGINKADFLKLEEAVKSGKATDKQKAEFENQTQILMEAGQALAKKEAAENWKKFNRDDPEIMAKATKAAQEAMEKKYPGGWAQANAQTKSIRVEEQLGNLQNTWEKNTAREAENLKNNKLTSVEIMDAINRSNMLVGVAEKRANGSPGGMAEDWGRESLVKLHGKEAVLTEAQLASMNKGGNTTIELADLKLLVESMNSLNKQAAVQNRLLGQMTENQRTMLNRTHGNRLMA